MPATFKITVSVIIIILLNNNFACSEFTKFKANTKFKLLEVKSEFGTQSSDDNDFPLGYNIITYSTAQGYKPDLTVRIKRDLDVPNPMSNTSQENTTSATVSQPTVGVSIGNSTDFPTTVIANASIQSNQSDTGLEVTSTASINTTVDSKPQGITTPQPLSTFSSPRMVTTESATNSTISPSSLNITSSSVPISSQPATANQSVTTSSSTNSSNGFTTTKPVITSKTELPPFLMNTTLPPNITNSTTEHDDRQYYTVKYISEAAEARTYWRNMDNAATHSTLNGHKVALQLVLPWDFQFYGHSVNRITVAVGGFLYMSPFLHKFLTATQYVAPLMANFDASQGVGSGGTNVFFANLEDALVIEWKNVHLHDQEDAGGFTFQAQLYKGTGKIIFAYKNVPIPLGNISATGHAVKVGIADAYYQDFGYFRTIFDYHNIGIDFEKITTDSAIILTHKTTCNLLTDCDACHSANLPNFECHWCESLGRCSDAMDRGRQEWMSKSCPITPQDREICTLSTTTTSKTTNINSTTTTTTGAAITSGTTTTTSVKTTTISSSKPLIDGSTERKTSEAPCANNSNNDSKVKDCTSSQKQVASATGEKHNTKALAVVITVPIVCVAIISSLVILFIYGYRTPTSMVGQFLIRNRPSEIRHRWSNRGDREDHYRVGSQILSNKAYEGDV